jgi:hypothetical protein
MQIRRFRRSTLRVRCTKVRVIDVEGDDPVVIQGSYNWAGGRRGLRQRREHADHPRS